MNFDRAILVSLVSTALLVWTGIARADDVPAHLAPTVHHAAHGSLPTLVHCQVRPLDAGTSGATVQVCVAVGSSK